MQVDTLSTLAGNLSKLHCVQIKTGPINIVNNCVKLMPALTKLNAQYFSTISKEVSPQPNSPDLNPVDHHIWSILEQSVYRTHIRDVSRLVTRLVEEWQMFDHSIIDWAIKQWRPRLWLCVREQGGHFEQ